MEKYYKENLAGELEEVDPKDIINEIKPNYQGVDLDLGTATNLETAIHYVVGFASMCWERTPQGAFDSSSAHSAALQLQKWIEERYVKKH